VVIIRDIEGLSGEDAASALGIDLSTMKTRLHRAREQLRETLLQKTRGT
jgi:RNA polymerase sigma-70 factor (ECF subfamily)